MSKAILIPTIVLALALLATSSFAIDCSQSYLPVSPLPDPIESFNHDKPNPWVCENKCKGNPACTGYHEVYNIDEYEFDEPFWTCNLYDKPMTRQMTVCTSTFITDAEK